MVLLPQYLLCSLVFLLSNAVPQIKPPKRTTTKEPHFPTPLPTMLPYDQVFPFHTFDGIDYDELPPALKNRHYDCYGEYIRCVENTNYFHYVCAYIVSSDYWGYFISMCSLELNNCRNRMWWNLDVFGTFYANDEYFYQGEGHNCEKSQNSREVRRGIFFEMGPFFKMPQNISEVVP